MQFPRFLKSFAVVLMAACQSWLRWLAVMLMLVMVIPAHSDSVGQVQTTKFFAPETVNLLKSRATSGTPGLAVGDYASYIIQFTPVPNGATIGAGGYITDYIPSGAKVVGAWFVQPDGAGDYTQINAPQPALMAPGWGRRGQASYNTNWTGLSIDSATVSACTAAGFTTANCNGRFSEVYADTGIFYSNDPRTVVSTYPDTDGRVRQSANGYNINPTGTGQLNPILGQTKATVHNYWDAANINAFGSTSTAIAALAAPKATTGQYLSAGGAQGTGVTPFNAGSAVAGPDAGYKLDYTGAVGPWRRISYPGSMIGSNASGPATASGVGVDVVGGSPTSAGWSLSTSNPLPSNTNAVRWAAGNLQVGSLMYVKITLQITAPVPTSGFVNNSEVFGGDAAQDALSDNSLDNCTSGCTAGVGDRDNLWRYNVPNVADNNSNVLITKSVVCVYINSVCTATSGSAVPVNPKIRYQIVYLNTGNSFQTNVQLNDFLDSTVTSAGNLYVVSGTDIRPSSPVLSVNSAAVGATRGADVALTTVTGGSTVTFPPLVSLPPGLGGAFQIDVQYTSPNGDIIANKAKITSAQVPNGANASASSLVSNTANLLVTKTTNTASVLPGGTATYTIKVTNVGSGNATSVVVQDFLPFYGTTADVTKNFTYITSTSVVGGSITSVTPVTATASVTPYSGNPNQQQITWTFSGTDKTLEAGGSITITFSTRVGSAVPANTYTNDVVVNYNNGSAVTYASANDTAPVTVTSPLTILKTVSCIYSGSTCVPYTGSQVVPSNGKLRYQINYANTGITTQNNVYLCDQLPTQVAALSSVVAAGTSSLTLGSPPTTANTACGFGSGGLTFSYPVTSLAAGATGTVYFDVQTNAASGTTLLNTGKIVSTQSAGGATSSATASVLDQANLTVTKTASASIIGKGGTVSYTITITNTGNAAAKTMTVYDFLPYTGTTADATTRFKYIAGTTAITGMTSVTPGTATAPTIAPYTSNTNQEQISWNFGSQTLASGTTLQITFQAQAGASIPASSTIYTNDVQVAYLSAAGAATAYISGAAPVEIDSGLTVTKTIDCVYNTAATACNAYDNSGIVPVNGKLRYKVVYGNTLASAQTSVFLCDTLPTQIAAYSAVTTPSIAPTPSGAYTDSPANSGRTNSANTACGLSTGTTFSYSLGSLPANTTGTVYYDVQTNAASGATVTNTSKIVSTYAPSGEQSSVSAVALAVPNVTVSKTTSTPTRTLGQTATYTITLTNTGSAATTSLKVYDFLPYSGSTNDATLRFGQGGSTVVTVSTGTVPAFTLTSSVSPTVSPYSSNSNQQQVLWDFSSYALPAGATLTLTFDAKVGSAMPSGSYNNSALAVYTGTGGSGSNQTSGATVIVSLPPTIAKAFDTPKAVSINGLTTLTFTLTNPNSMNLTGGSFTDDFPSGSVLGATSVGGTCAGAALASRAGTSGGFGAATVGHVSVQLTGITVPASSSCTVLIKVQGTTVGAKANTSSVLASSNIVSSTGTASDTLSVYLVPTVTKVFGTSTIVATGTTTLSITLTNPATNPGNLTGISVADVFPAMPGAMTLASISATNGCSAGSGVLQGKTGAGAYATPLVVGNTAIQLNGLTLAPGANCTVVVTITASSAGTYTNTTTAVISTGPIALTGAVSNTATLVVTAQYPTLAYQKTVSTLSDPINGTNNPKRIPGAEVLYTIRVTNVGPGTVDSNSMILTDVVPVNTEFYATSPITFASSTTPVSGMTWTYTSLSSTTDDLSFSNTVAPGPYLYTYTPVPGSDGYDPAITAIRMNPKGTMAGGGGSNNPYVEFQFKVRIK